MSTTIRCLLATIAIVVLTLSGGAFGKLQGGEPASPAIGNAEPRAGDSLKSTSTFYLVRRDRRRCMSPICGGFFVRRANLASTPCVNGQSMQECYVATIEWEGHAEVEAEKALLRGSITSRRFERGNFGVLIVTEAWQAASDNQPSGNFFRVRDRGLRCVTSPCPTHHESKLNSTVSGNIAGVDLTGVGAAEDSVSNAFKAMTGQDGVMVTGEHAPVKGPGGRSQKLKASQFYLQTGKEQASAPCRKTGCSKQICSDHDVMSTCEWRDEYACYQKATCERQRDGKCGFTKTPELTACLAKK